MLETRPLALYATRLAIDPFDLLEIAPLEQRLREIRDELRSLREA
jgi:hypothetical protein